MPVGGAPPWLTHTSTIRQSHGKCSRDFRVQGLLEVRLASTRRPAKQGFPCFHSQGRGVAASYCAFAECELRSVIHHHKATPRNHRLRKSLCRPKASSYGRPWAPASPKSPRGRKALFLWAVTQHLPWMGTCPFTRWLPTREESMFTSVVVNKQYSTGGRGAAVPWRSCMGTLGSGVPCLPFWKPPHLLLLVTDDSALKHRA